MFKHFSSHSTALTNVSIFKNSEEIRIEITLLGSVTDRQQMSNQPSKRHRTGSQGHTSHSESRKPSTTHGSHGQVEKVNGSGITRC